MMAAEIVQLNKKLVQETEEFPLNDQIQNAELSAQISFYERGIKILKFVLMSMKTITSGCSSGVILFCFCTF